MASLQTSTAAGGGIGVESATPYFLISRQTFSKSNRKETMKYTAMLLSLSLIFFTGPFAEQELAAEADKKSQTISRAGSQPSVKGSSEYFTGNVRVDPLFPAKGCGALFRRVCHLRARGHDPFGTFTRQGSTCSLPQGSAEPGEIGTARLREIKAGDVIWCPPKVKHWHGASPTTAMTHIAITGTLDGKNVDWMEKVTDEQYNGK